MVSAQMHGHQELLARLRRAPVSLERGAYESVGRLLLRLQRTIKMQLSKSAPNMTVRSELRRESNVTVGVLNISTSKDASAANGAEGAAAVKGDLRVAVQGWGRSQKGRTPGAARAPKPSVQFPMDSFLRGALAGMRGPMVAELRQQLSRAIAL